MSQLHHWSLILGSFPLLLLTTPTQARTFVQRIPSPNVCVVVGGGTASFNWESLDCPLPALCLPSSCSSNSSTTTRFCSCSHSEFVLIQQPDGRCGPSTSTYAYSVYCMFQTCCAVATSVYIIHSFWTAHKHTVLKLDVFFASAFFNLTSSGLHATQAFLFGYNMTIGSTKSWKSQAGLFGLSIIILASYATSIVLTTMVFGISAYSTVFQSHHLKIVDLKRLQRCVVMISFAFGVAICVGGIVLLATRQFAPALGYFGGFAIVVWVLFRRILKYSVPVTLESAISQSKTFRSASITETEANSPTKQQHRFQQQAPPHKPLSVTAATLHEIRILASRIAPVMFSFAFLAFVYNILWFVGRKHCNQAMLGRASAAVDGALYGVLLFGIIAFAVFMRHVVNIRIRHKQETHQKLANATLL